MQMIKQRGAALITALVVLAICSALATFVMLSQRLIIHHASLAMEGDKLTVLLEGVQDWACEVVQTHKDIRNVDSLHLTINGTEVTGKVYALEGRFNVNVLQNTANLPRFVRLVNAVSPSISQNQAMHMALELSRWVGRYRNVDDRADAAHYPHQPMVSLSELRLLPSIPYSLYAKLVLGKQPYLTALPTSDFKLNVNYASVNTFMTLMGVNSAEASQLAHCRAQQIGYFKQVSDFISQCAKGIQLNPSVLTTKNNYYLVVGKAKKGEQHMQMQALLYLVFEDDEPTATIIWQEDNNE